MLLLFKILTLLLIATIVYYILTVITTFFETIRSTSNKNNDNDNEEGGYHPSRIHLLFGPTLIFLLLIWKYQYLLKAFIPIVAIFYWIVVIGLIVILIIISVFLYKWYSKDKANALQLQEFKIACRETIIMTLILYAYVNDANIPYAPAKVIVILFLYYFLQKIYIRIVKQLDFIDESDDQQDQTRFNNKILLFFPIWCLIFFFASKPVEFLATLLYLGTFYSYYNRPLPMEEKWPVIKAPIGSAERAELYWEAFNAITEPPIEIHVSKTVYTQEMNYQKRVTMATLGIDTDETFDIYNPGHSLVMHLGDDITNEDELFDDELFMLDMKIKVAEVRNYKRYMQKKKCPIHEYYFWWLMTDVPFYFGIRAFLDMVWDTICNISRVILLCYISIWYFWCISPYFHINVHNWNELMAHYHIGMICAYIIIYYMGITDLTRPYSWLIFYYRKEAYRMYDLIHPYAIYGPTVDGPRNWQYWFFIIFNCFPVRALILQKELFAEEIRITEGLLKLNIYDIDDDYDEEVTEEPMIWNPFIWYRLRNATPAEREAIKQAVLKDRAAQETAEKQKEAFKQVARPKWWTHYSI